MKHLGSRLVYNLGRLSPYSSAVQPLPHTCLPCMCPIPSSVIFILYRLSPKGKSIFLSIVYGLIGCLTARSPFQQAYHVSRSQQLTWWIHCHYHSQDGWPNINTQVVIHHTITLWQHFYSDTTLLCNQGSLRPLGSLQPPRRNISSGFSVTFCLHDSGDKIGCFPVYISLLKNPWSPLICHITSEVTLLHHPAHRNMDGHKEIAKYVETHWDLSEKVNLSWRNGVSIYQDHMLCHNSLEEQEQI